ncbi:MAG: hypothetical protein CVT92_05850 [Bacteroidetes bacterium HGW-Bacteroidetes-1]|jgi:cytidylate kinase|nr:MAG: hypothetical protein CVT92_05850 [Bacteroidetes bacterium HGW-Bacteroidetes-1]
MAIDLIQYLNQRKEEEKSIKKSKLPFVTLSREAGCNSMNIVRELQFLIKNTSKVKWNIFNKEIVEKEAKLLDIDLMQVRRILDANRRGHLDEILRAFGSRYYKSDRSIRNTLRNLVSTFAQEGNVIIVGRAGAIITAGMSGGLHIRLVAPIEWRIKNIQRQKDLTEAQANEYVKTTDEQRSKLLYEFSKKQICEIHFDMVFNNASLTDIEIASMIFGLMKQRNMVP